MPEGLPFNGVRLFRYALITEATMNLASAVPMILNPDYMLSFMVKGPAQITPFTRTMTQWLGGIVIGMTVPLVLSIPHVPRAPAGRRMTYTMLGACEVGLSAVMAMQYFQGADSGLKPQALVSAMGIFGAILLERVFFLFVRPTWMEGQDNAKKVQ